VADGVRRDEEFSGTKTVEERHRSNELRLDKWMGDHVEGFSDAGRAAIQGGQSNPTYRLDTAGLSYVDAPKTVRQILPSAHGVTASSASSPRLASMIFRAKAYALCTERQA